MGRYGGILIVAACCLWMGCHPSVKLSSMVTDMISDEPVPGATVKLVDLSDAILDSVMTDSSGMFQLTLKDLDKKEEYWLVVNKPPLSDLYREHIRFDRKLPIAAQIRLPLMAGITGMVKSEDGGAITGAKVEVVRVEWTETEPDSLRGKSKRKTNDWTETRLDGSFSIGALEPGDYKLRIRYVNHRPTQTEYLYLFTGYSGALSRDARPDIRPEWQIPI